MKKDFIPLVQKKRETFSNVLKSSLDEPSKPLTVFNYTFFVVVNIATCGLTTLALYGVHKVENRKCVEYV